MGGSGSQIFGMRRGWVGGGIGGFCVNSLNCAPKLPLRSPFTSLQLKYLQTKQRHGRMFANLLVITELLFLT